MGAKANHRRKRRPAVLAALALLAVFAMIAAGCVPEEPPADPVPDPGPPPALQVSTNPPLFPAFDPGITDYVVRCADAPVEVTADAPEGMTVSIAGAPPAGGHVVVSVPSATGESFTIVNQTNSVPTSTYYVRCLPTDFPTWTATRTGPTQAEYYITSPNANPTYPAIYDNNGVPIWWGPKTPTLFATLLDDGNIAWTRWDSAPAEEHHLDGSLVQKITTSGGAPDLHDLLRLANGDYVMVANVVRTGIDLTAMGGPASAPILDQIIQEIDPDGNVVWSWDTADHITVAETDPQWFTPVTCCLGAPPYDVFHWNSIEVTPTGYLVSFRHLDAVYEIDRTTGDIVWKLGGTPRPESLTIYGDPVFASGSHFGGQHDARMLADGSVTLYDDGTGLGRAPRAVHYQINASEHWAQLIGEQYDALVPTSPWGGSARLLGGGDWVVGWGGTNGISELDATGAEVFRMEFPGAGIYRVIPVPYGQLSRDALRAAMDHPAQTAATADTWPDAPAQI